MKKTHQAVTAGGTALSRYQDVIIGSRSWTKLIRHELLILLSPIPGAAGLMLRKLFWPQLFGSCGRNCLFGTNIVLRHSHRIHLGDSVVAGDGCIMDARNDQDDKTIEVGDEVIFSNNVMLSCKNGTISIGPRTGINTQSIIQSTNQCPVSIGADVIIGPQCYIVGGGNYNIQRTDIPIRDQGIEKDNGVDIGPDVWFGASVTAICGVRIGEGSIAAAGTFINRDVAPFDIVAGTPARLIRNRKS